ncbi:NAD(P)-dependent oxidoreductase [uncultured Cloacibacillus sp.]|uniref:NAD-dependent epimerase/dehydratase family protein n=1 Tax=uncultured Cloacibacillus sp. TaxID=889794 RepID=UPI0026DC75DF|nr:NAD-dependent epimerase/dehydratase family protein [uncultured Cloacibacillus sp.]
MSMIAVTGITGKTGYWFYQRLISYASKHQDMSCRFASRSLNGLKFITPTEHMQYAIGDINESGFCKTFLDGVDTLVHIAGIRYSFPLLDIAVEKGVKRFILVHTTGMYSKYKKAAKPYITLEARIHELATQHDINVTILRPTMIYGTLDDKNISVFIKMVDKLHLFPVINGAVYELQPVHAKDLGDAYFSVLMNPEITANKEYNLSGGQPIMLIDMLKIISEYMGKHPRFISVPFPLAYFGACIAFYATLTKLDYREKVQRMIEPRVFAHDSATKDFGYAPVTFQDGVKEEVLQYMRKIKQ